MHHTIHTFTKSLSYCLCLNWLTSGMNGDIIIDSHQIQSVGCWSPCALCHGVRSCEWCGASCCCRPSSSLCLGPHRGLCWRVRGNPPQSDGVGRRSGVAPCRAAPSPIARQKCTRKLGITKLNTYIHKTHAKNNLNEICACDSNNQPLGGSKRLLLSINAERRGYAEC